MKLGKFKKRWTKFAAPVALFSALTLGCGNSSNDFVFNPGTGNVVTPIAQTGDLAVELDLINARAVSSAVSTIELRLVQNNEVVLEREFLRAQSGTEQTLTVSNILVGDYLLQLFFLAENGSVIGTFESSVTISPGTTTVIDDPDYTPLTFVASSSRTVELEIDSRPMAATAADFDEDGILDLAVAGQDSDEVYVLLGNADGSYQNPTELTGTDYAREIISTDLDDDGDVDLVVANWNDKDLSIFYGNGDGTFEAETELNVGGSHHSVKAVDLDGDTNLDLVVCDENNDEIDIFLGDGARGFTAQPSVDSPRTWPNRVLVLDLDGDSEFDLAFNDFETSELFVAIGNGDGTFGAPTAYTSTATRPFSMTAGDIDQDGDMDIVFSSRDGSALPIFTNNGSGGFSQTGTVQSGQDAIWAELADVTGDGVLDLLATSADDNGVYTSVGNGDGTFRPAPDAPLQTLPGPFFLLVQDLNLDNILDLLTVNRGNNGNEGSQDGGPASLSIFYGE